MSDAAYAVTESRPRACHGCGASHDVVHLVAVGAALLCPACVVAAAQTLPPAVAPRYLPSGAYRVTYMWDGPNGWVHLEISQRGEHWTVHVGHPREWTPGPQPKARHVNWLGGTLIIWET